MSDFAVSTEVTATDKASPVLRGVKREALALAKGLKTHLSGEFARAGLDVGKAWGAIKGGSKAAFDSVTSVGGAVKATGAMASLAVKGIGAASKIAFWGATGLISGLTAGAVAVKSLVDEFVDAGDEIGSTATKLGIGTQALQELRYAADLSDIDPKEFDAGIGKLNINLGKAKRKTGELYSALIKTRDGKVVLKDLLNAKSVDEATTVIIEAASRIPDVTKRTDFLAVALGEAGVAWVKFGDTGAEGVAKLRKEARDAGLLTDDQIGMANDLDNANKKLGYTWRGLKFAIAAELAPAVLDLTNRLRDYLTENKGVIASKVAGAIKTIAGWVKKVAGWLYDAYTATRDWLVNGGWDLITKKIGEVWKGFKEVKKWIGEAYDKIGGFRGAIVALGSAVVLGSVFRLGAALATATGGAAAAQAAVAAAAGGAGAAGAGAGAAGAGAAGMGAAAGGAAAVGIALVAWEAYLGIKEETQRYNDERANSIGGAEAQKFMNANALNGGAGAPAAFQATATTAFDPSMSQINTWDAMRSLGRSAPSKPSIKSTPAGPAFERPFVSPSTDELIRRISGSRAVGAGPAKVDLNITVSGAPAGSTVEARATGSGAASANVGRRRIGLAP